MSQRAVWPPPATPGSGRAPRRSADRRGRLRVGQVRPRRARHQRRRLPGPAALGRGGGVPRRDGRRPGTRRHLRRPRGRAERPARGSGARGGVADRLPAPAQGQPPQARGRQRRGVRHPRARPSSAARCCPRSPVARPTVLDSLVGSAGLDEAATAVADALRSPGAVILVGERLAGVPGGLERRAAPGRGDRRAARLGSPACGRAGRCRGRRRALTPARGPSRRRCLGAGGRRLRRGASPAAHRRRPRHRGDPRCRR